MFLGNICFGPDYCIPGNNTPIISEAVVKYDADFPGVCPKNVFDNNSRKIWKSVPQGKAVFCTLAQNQLLAEVYKIEFYLRQKWAI